MFGVDGTPVVEWSAFAKSSQPAGRDSELYRAWYAIACQDYNASLAHLQDCTRQAAIYRSSTTDVPTSDLDMIQETVDLMTSIVERERATAVHIMCSRETASTEEIMRSKLFKYVWKNFRAQASITESRGSQLGGAPADGVV
jgi:hypothetical protein